MAKKSLPYIAVFLGLLALVIKLRSTSVVHHTSSELASDEAAQESLINSQPSKESNSGLTKAENHNTAEGKNAEALQKSDTQTRSLGNETGKPSGSMPTGTEQREADLLQLTQKRNSFLQMRSGVERAIPTKKDLQKLSEKEVHFTPKSLFAASVEVVKISDELDREPRLIPEGLDFYRSCARNEDYPNSIRANCVFQYENYAKKSSGQPKDLEGDGLIPERVKKLARDLK